MSQLSFLDSVISATVNGSDSGGFPVKSGPAILHENHTGGGCSSLATAGGKLCFASAREYPWHNQGVVVDADFLMTAEMLGIASMAGHDVQKEQAYIFVNGELKPIPGKFGVYRADEGTVFSAAVGSGYEVCQIEEVFSFADSVFGEIGAKWVTAGALGDGSRFWGVAKLAGECEAADGDKLESYAFFASSHDGSMGITVAPTIVRVVCKNTFSAALRLARMSKVARSFRHTKNVKANIAAARKALGVAIQDTARFSEVAQELAQKPFAPEQTADLFDVCLDDIIDLTVAGQRVTGKSISDRSAFEAAMQITEIDQRQKSIARIEKAQEKRADLLREIIAIHQGERCEGIESIRGSAWSAVNAVSEFVEHGGRDSSAFRYNGSEQDKAENRMQSVLTGRAQAITQAAVEYAVKA